MIRRIAPEPHVGRVMAVLPALLGVDYLMHGIQTAIETHALYPGVVEVTLGVVLLSGAMLSVRLDH